MCPRGLPHRAGAMLGAGHKQKTIGDLIRAPTIALDFPNSDCANLSCSLRVTRLIRRRLILLSFAPNQSTVK